MQRLLRNTLATLVFCTPLAAHAITYTDMVVLGDSLSDSGNLYALTSNTVPVSPYYFNGRFQNGPSYAEGLWDNLGFAGGLTPSYLGGTNFAVGGARTRYHAADVGLFGVPVPANPPFESWGLLGQLDQYHAARGTSADPDALYVVWAGANDLQDVLSIAGGGDPLGAQTRFTEAVTDVATVIGTLVAEGARELLVPTLPDFGLLPIVQAAGAQTLGTTYSKLFNDSLDLALAGLMATPDLRITRFDTFGLLQAVIADPAAYGLANVTDPCLENFYVDGFLSPGPATVCGTPDEYLFWDIIHPSARMHQVLAQGMTLAVPEPGMPALLLLGGLGLWAGLAWRRGRTHA